MTKISAFSEYLCLTNKEINKFIVRRSNLWVNIEIDCKFIRKIKMEYSLFYGIKMDYSKFLLSEQNKFYQLLIFTV